MIIKLTFACLGVDCTVRDNFCNIIRIWKGSVADAAASKSAALLSVWACPGRGSQYRTQMYSYLFIFCSACDFNH